jgi:hypothetical protein
MAHAFAKSMKEIKVEKFKTCVEIVEQHATITNDDENFGLMKIFTTMGLHIIRFDQIVTPFAKVCAYSMCL